MKRKDGRGRYPREKKPNNHLPYATPDSSINDEKLLEMLSDAGHEEFKAAKEYAAHSIRFWVASVMLGFDKILDYDSCDEFLREEGCPQEFFSHAPIIGMNHLTMIFPADFLHQLRSMGIWLSPLPCYQSLKVLIDITVEGFTFKQFAERLKHEQTVKRRGRTAKSVGSAKNVTLTHLDNTFRELLQGPGVVEITVEEAIRQKEAEAKLARSQGRSPDFSGFVVCHDRDEALAYFANQARSHEQDET